MNAKERFYSGLAKETIGKITSNTDNWTSFLRTMSRNYEFTYPEQVMIYAQRPNATFCKPYEDWNAENYRRYVKRGSTGIALFVMNRDKPYLRYVFDVADTGVRRSSPELKPWEVTPENRSYVMEAMERTFGVAADGVLEAQLEDIASALAAEYWDDYKKQFLDIVANSFLEEYDELNIEVAFKNAVANSVSYNLLQDDDFSIVQTYQQEYRGLVQYYILAQNLSWFSKLYWYMETSLLKTLACKHRSSINKQKAKYKTTTTSTSGKTVPCLQVVVERPNKKPLVATWGGISLVHKRKAVIEDIPYKVYGGRTELVKRLLAEKCELCGSTENIEVHHIRKLADLKKKGQAEVPKWVQIMSARKRKTLVVCRECHVAIHNGNITKSS